MEIYKADDGDAVSVSGIQDGRTILAVSTERVPGEKVDFNTRLTPEQDVRLAAALLERAAEHYRQTRDYGRVDAARGSLAAIIREADEKVAREEQKAQDEAELVQFILDVDECSEEYAKGMLEHDGYRQSWVDRKRKVYRKAQKKVLKEQGYDIESVDQMNANCDYRSHDGTLHSGMDWFAWPLINDEKFPMKMLRNYSTHPVRYVDGVDING